MIIKLQDNIHSIDPEAFVIAVFDGIKCASGTGKAFNLHLDASEVKYLAMQIKEITNIEIS